MKKCKKLCLLLAVILVVAAAAAFYFISQRCEHEWQDATCHSAQTCALCGETQGEVLAHDWQQATCTLPETCALCGDVQGEAAGHAFAPATCLTPETCTVCGETQGEVAGHAFAPATCQLPETCAICGETQGEVTDHSFAAATCQTPETCAFCGETRGDVADHSFAAATCQTPETCTFCGETRGDVAPHTFSAATCVAPETCSFCGLTQGETAAHTFSPATCLAPETCTFCGLTQGELAPHVWTDSSCASPSPCSVCGTTEGMELTHRWMDGREVCLDCGLDLRTTDVKFMHALADGLEARWALTSADLAAAKEATLAEALLQAQEAGKELSEEEAAYLIETTLSEAEQFFRMSFTHDQMVSYITAEYDALISFRGAQFEDAEFGEWAESYIDGVLVSLEELEMVTEDTAFVDQYTRDGFHMQSVALYNLNLMIPITVAEENQESLQLILFNGEMVDKVSAMMEMVSFQNVSTLANGLDKFEAIVTNTTGFTFATFTFDVDLYDINDQYIETKNINVKNWPPDEKETFTFTAGSEVRKLQLAFANWMFPDGEVADEQLQSEEVPAETAAESTETAQH